MNYTVNYKGNTITLEQLPNGKFKIPENIDQLAGSYGGFQPKPAWEAIIVAMKPLSEKTYVDQALKNGKGISWLDDCRVPTGGEVPKGSGNSSRDSIYSQVASSGGNGGNVTPEAGRFPANLLVSDDVLNDGRVLVSGAAKIPTGTGKGKDGSNPFSQSRGGKVVSRFVDSGSYSRYFDLDSWWTKLSGTSSTRHGLEHLGALLDTADGNSTAYSDHEYDGRLLLDTLDRLEGSDASFCSLRNSLLSNEVSDVLREIAQQDSLGDYLSSFHLDDVHAHLSSNIDPTVLQLLSDVHKLALEYLSSDDLVSIYDSSDHQRLALAYLLACITLSILTDNRGKLNMSGLTEQQMKTFPFAIFPKASKSEKNKGLEHFEEKEIGRQTSRKCANCGGSIVGMGQNNPCVCDNRVETNTSRKNHHPTVKPLKLMSYLITLFSREGDTVLDPFVGSGTTAVAAKQLGRNAVGIERETEYAEIAVARLAHAEKIEEPESPQMELV